MISAFKFWSFYFFRLYKRSEITTAAWSCFLRRLLKNCKNHRKAQMVLSFSKKQTFSKFRRKMLMPMKIPSLFFLKLCGIYNFIRLLQYLWTSQLLYLAWRVLIQISSKDYMNVMMTVRCWHQNDLIHWHLKTAIRRGYYHSEIY